MEFLAEYVFNFNKIEISLVKRKECGNSQSPSWDINTGQKQKYSSK